MFNSYKDIKEVRLPCKVYRIYTFKKTYLYDTLGSIKPNLHPALLSVLTTHTLHVKVIVGCVVSVVVVGLPIDIFTPESEVFLNSKADFLSSLNVVFFINLILSFCFIKRLYTKVTLLIAKLYQVPGRQPYCFVNDHLAM